MPSRYMWGMIDHSLNIIQASQAILKNDYSKPPPRHVDAYLFGYVIYIIIKTRSDLYNFSPQPLDLQ